MDPDTIGTGALGIGLLVAGVYNGWQAAQAKREARSARNHAETAADHSKPVSNGFTAEVRAGMAEILAIATQGRDEATRARQLGEDNRDAIQRHLEAHANGHLYPIGGRRVAP